MRYSIKVTEEVRHKLRSLSEDVRQSIGYRLFLLEDGLTGDVKKLKGSTNEYRLRVGDHRVLFELEGHQIMVYAIGNRKDIYR